MSARTESGDPPGEVVPHPARAARVGARAVAAPLALVVLTILAFAVRLDGITAPPFDNAVSRQFHAALVARLYYADGSPGLTRQEQRVVDAWQEEVELIEPPAMELLAATGYELLGREALWIPRGASALIWVVGAFLLYRLARRFQRPPAALVACGVYLLLPFAVLASRSFQPESLLVTSILLAVLAIVRYDERPTWGRLVAATVASAGALLVKPGLAAGFVFVTFAALAYRRLGLRRAVLNRHSIVFCLCVAPMFAWYAYGTFVERFLGGHLSSKLGPELLVERSFWRGWWREVTYVSTYPVGVEALAVVVVAARAAGVALARPGKGRTLLVALWGGYAVLGLVFAEHISTHNYYSLPLAPLVGLSLGSLVDAGLRRVRLSTGTATTAVALGSAVAAAAVLWKLHPVFVDPVYEAKAARYKAIGRAADHTARALYVDEHYGDPASYYGWMSGTLLTSGWEDGDPNALARQELAAALAGDRPRSCVVLTGGGLLPRVREFEAELESRFAPRSRTAEYAIFDLDRMPPSRSNGC